MHSVGTQKPKGHSVYECLFIQNRFIHATNSSLKIFTDRRTVAVFTNVVVQLCSRQNDIVLDGGSGAKRQRTRAQATVFGHTKRSLLRLVPNECEHGGGRGYFTPIPAAGTTIACLPPNVHNFTEYPLERQWCYCKCMWASTNDYVRARVCVWVR